MTHKKTYRPFFFMYCMCSRFLQVLQICKPYNIKKQTGIFSLHLHVLQIFAGVVDFFMGTWPPNSSIRIAMSATAGHAFLLGDPHVRGFSSILVSQTVSTIHPLGSLLAYHLPSRFQVLCWFIINQRRCTTTLFISRQDKLNKSYKVK